MVELCYIEGDNMEKAKVYFTKEITPEGLEKIYNALGVDKVKIWDEMEEYLLTWKASDENIIELNFEKDWEETKKELLENVPKKNWKKIIKNDKVVNEILPILFPTNKYKEILDELKIK